MSKIQAKSFSEKALAHAGEAEGWILAVWYQGLLSSPLGTLWAASLSSMLPVDSRSSCF